VRLHPTPRLHARPSAANSHPCAGKAQERAASLRASSDVRKPVQAGELVCDGAQRADRVVLGEDAPGRVLLASGFGWGCRTRSEALALAGFAV